MLIREASTNNIPQLQSVRQSVRENILSNPGLVKYSDYTAHLTTSGKGWVCEVTGEIVGFAIADLQAHNIWALFLRPGFEKQGIGRLLHDTMLNWYFKQTQQTVSLGTEPGTRAERFYRKCGWAVAGTHANGEIHFEMTYNRWRQLREA